MLTMLGSPRRSCDGVTRRETLKAGALSVLGGFGLPHLLLAAYVKDRPVSTGDICATIFECLGIDPDMTVPDRTGRPIPIANGGHSIRDILACTPTERNDDNI